MDELKTYYNAIRHCKEIGARLFETMSLSVDKMVYDKPVEVSRGHKLSWIGHFNKYWLCKNDYSYTSSQTCLKPACILFGRDSKEKRYQLESCYNKHDFICEVV